MHIWWLPAQPCHRTFHCNLHQSKRSITDRLSTNCLFHLSHFSIQPNRKSPPCWLTTHHWPLSVSIICICLRNAAIIKIKVHSNLLKPQIVHIFCDLSDCPISLASIILCTSRQYVCSSRVKATTETAPSYMYPVQKNSFISRCNFTINLRCIPLSNSVARWHAPPLFSAGPIPSQCKYVSATTTRLIAPFTATEQITD